MQSYFRLLLLYPHLVSCCISIGCIFLFDLKMASNKFKLNQKIIPFLQEIAKIISICLIILWITGIGIIIYDFNGIPNLSQVLNKPKLCVKLIVVTILTINGYFLHHLVINKSKTQDKSNFKSYVAYTSQKYIYAVGALSACSWFYAIFLGIAKPLTSIWGLSEFLWLYITLIFIFVLGIYALISILKIATIVKIFKLKQILNKKVY